MVSLSQQMRNFEWQRVHAPSLRRYLALYLSNPFYCVYRSILATSSENNRLVPLLARNDESGEACQIREYKEKVIRDFAGNWAEFFIHFRDENKEKLDEIILQNTRLYEHILQNPCGQGVHVASQKSKQTPCRIIAERTKPGCWGCAPIHSSDWPCSFSEA